MVGFIKEIGLRNVTLFIAVGSSLVVDYYKLRNIVDKIVLLCYNKGTK